MHKTGSLDASIKEEVANDFPALFAKYPNISHVFFNGSKAERSFLLHAKPALSEDRHVFARLPSTSPYPCRDATGCQSAGMVRREEGAVLTIQRICVAVGHLFRSLKITLTTQSRDSRQPLGHIPVPCPRVM